MSQFSAIIALGVFGMLALSSGQIGRGARRAGLPLITGYLLAGILAGPFALNMITADAIGQLKFVEEIALAVIAFAAGAELHLHEIAGQIRRISWNVAIQIVLTLALGVVAFLLLAGKLPFTADLSPPLRLAAGLLAATILIASSPSSAIALVNELRAKGPFTKTALGVTMIKDVLIIVLFALNVQIADVIFTGASFSPLFALVVVAALLGSLAAGYGLSWLVRLALSRRRIPAIWKIAVMLALGLTVFQGSAWLHDWTRAHFSFEIVLEPLLICMIAGFVMVNYTPHAPQFAELLEESGPPVYIAFFTLTGAALRLDILAQTWPIALALFGVRVGALLLSGLISGTLAREPFQQRALSWMMFLTQAGVGLGLAQEAAIEFPALGSAFATTMISTIVISQVIGPPLMKFAIRRVGEAHEPGKANPDEVRDALLFGVDHQAMALARLLRDHGWQVILADTDNSRIESANDPRGRHVPDITRESFGDLMTDATDAVVAMCEDDLTNLKVCELAYEMGVSRVIVRLDDVRHRDLFTGLDAHIIDPTQAMINLMEHLVRSPLVVSQIIREDPDHDMAQITVTNPDLHGIAIRNLRLPPDVLILGIERAGQSIVPHGHTVLLVGDEITLAGSDASLDQVTLKLGF